MILETLVGRARWCVWAGAGREATRRQAAACNKARQWQAHARTCQRVRSVFKHMKNVNEGREACIHDRLLKPMSGQPRFPG